MFSNKTLLTKRQHTLFGAWIIVCQLQALEIIENQGRTKFEKIVNYISIKMPKTIKSQTKRKGTIMAGSFPQTIEHNNSQIHKTKYSKVGKSKNKIQFSSVQLHSCVQLFVTP